HRGFETVTLAFEGSVAHHDSTGSGGVIGPGDAQWMTAGAGILHREYHEEKFARSGGTMHMAQIWVNLPSKDKMTTPRYQALTAQQMGRVVLPESAGLVRVIAGEHAGVKGPASTFTPITMLDVQLDRAARVELDVPATQNAALLVMSGSVTVNGKSRATTDDLVLLDSGEHVGEHIAIASDDAARVLVLAGEPIREPIVQYGPFVMNTRQEIEQAIIDFNAGKFGHLDD
ncbi:MAG TPA: pirin family protein, partial [Polyangiales bacterium]|nr:pirin family protein [Polyangiales bacterium]